MLMLRALQLAPRAAPVGKVTLVSFAHPDQHSWSSAGLFLLCSTVKVTYVHTNTGVVDANDTCQVQYGNIYAEIRLLAK